MARKVKDVEPVNEEEFVAAAHEKIAALIEANRINREIGILAKEGVPRPVRAVYADHRADESRELGARIRHALWEANRISTEPLDVLRLSRLLLREAE